jgi:AraC-like DNA-binding protein
VAREVNHITGCYSQFHKKSRFFLNHRCVVAPSFVVFFR